MRGSGRTLPSACGTPLTIRAVISLAALPMSIWPTAMSNGRPFERCRFRQAGDRVFGRGVGDRSRPRRVAEIEPLLMMRPPCGRCSRISLKAAARQ